MGILLQGGDCNASIEGNKIENNTGAGIKVGLASKPIISNNEIKLNQVGIDVVSAEPIITKNKIEKNFTFGIMTWIIED